MARFFNRNIPDAAHQAMGDLSSHGISAVAFGPGGAWALVAPDGKHASANLPPGCAAKLDQAIAAGEKVAVIAFPPAASSWLIVTDRGVYQAGVPAECLAKIQSFRDAGHAIRSVAFPAAGGNRWLVLAGRALYARDIPDECYQIALNYGEGQNPARQAAFTPEGGFCVLTDGYHFARNVPSELYQKLGEFSDGNDAVDHVAFTPGGGWSVISNGPKQGNGDPVREFEVRTFQENGQWQSIWDRMARHRVPGASVAVVLDNKVAWRCSYGVLHAGEPAAVLAHHPFQAASCSKTVAAVGFLRLAQDGLIDHPADTDPLDVDITAHLGWTLPVRACADSAWRSQVTLRKLLRHRGGIIGRMTTFPVDQCSNFASGGGGFDGYPAGTDDAHLPTLLEILDGKSTRAGVKVNSPRVELVYQPGSTSSYSGAGYELMEQLLGHLRGVPFASWMHDNVLRPLGMAHSAFASAVPAGETAAAGHDKNGAPIPGLRNRYPEAAAAGLYTTPGDLARVLVMLNGDGTIDGTALLAAQRAGDVTVRGAGVDVWTGGKADGKYAKGGDNAGFKCVLIGYPGHRAGFVLMTNSDSGSDLNNELKAALERIYGFPS